MGQATDPTTPVTRVGLKRLQVGELVRTDVLLRSCGLLRDLDEHVLEQLLGDAVARRYPPGALLLRDDGGERPLLLILAGEVTLLAGLDGAAAEVGTARKGEVIGEEGLLAGTSANKGLRAVAQGPVDVAELPLAAVRGAVAACPALAHYLRSVDGTRTAACSEMSDFLGRW